MEETAQEPTAADQLAELRDKLGRLSRTREPIARNNLAVEALAEVQRVLRAVRKQAAQDAVAGGMRPSDYARAIGVTPGAVDHLLHR